MDDKKTQTEEPFFARFLEDQQEPEVQTSVKAGKFPGYVTMKWPSDNDEDSDIFI